MTFIAAAVIGGGVALAGGAMASSAAKKAASTQAASADRATELQRQMFEVGQQQQAPYRDMGNLYLNKLGHLLGQTPTVDKSTDPTFGRLSQPFDMGKFQQDPGYAFRQQEGERGMQRAAAAGGTMGSGRYLKDAMKYNSGLASQEYGQAYDRYNNDNNLLYNRYASMAGIGQTAANNLSTGAANFGQQAGQNIMGAGNARAAGTVGGANAMTGALGQGVSSYQNAQLMNRLFPQGGATSMTPITDDGYSSGTGASYNGNYSRM